VGDGERAVYGESRIRCGAEKRGSILESDAIRVRRPRLKSFEKDPIGKARSPTRSYGAWGTRRELRRTLDD
jgi:hypothetical protein